MNYCVRLCKYPKHIVLGMGFLLLFGVITHAQGTSDGPPQLNIKDFAVFGGGGGSSNGVELTTNIDILGKGAIGTNSNLKIGTHVSILGDIYASTVNASTGNTINGTTSIFGNPNATDPVLQFGAQSLFTSP